MKESHPERQDNSQTEHIEQVQLKLILFNDDVNTFDHVIESLIEVCGHDYIQAEQCTLLVHLTGQCVVQTGEEELLTPMKRGLEDRALTAEIQR